MFHSLILRAVMALCLAAPVMAGSDVVSPDDAAQFDILPGWRMADGTHMAALRIKLAPGWKTYWRAPGEAGIPPRFDWKGSTNLRAVTFHWPTPHVYYQNGMRTVAYKDELVLPMQFTPDRAGAPIGLNAMIELGVCQDICMPISIRIATKLDAGGKPDARIKSAIAAAPTSARGAGLKGVTCGVEPIADGLRLTATIDMPKLGRDEVAVFELSDQSIWISEADATRSGPTLTATTEMVPQSGKPFMLDRSDVRITVFAADRAVEIAGCAAG